MSNAPANWYPDPFGRFHQRYFDGASWTAHVADAAGNQSSDATPLTPTQPTGGTPQAGQAQQPTPGWTQQQPQAHQPSTQPQPGGWPQQPQAQQYAPPSGQYQQPGHQQYAQPGQQVQQPAQPQYAGGGYGTQPSGQPPGGDQSSSPVTKNFIGAIVAGIGAVVMFIGCFALDWLTAGGEGIDRSEIGDLLDAASDRGISVNFLPDSFFSWGWIIAVIISIGAVVVALLKLPPLRIAGAVLALLGAIWALAATIDVQESGISLGIGMWLTVAGLAAGAIGAIVALVQDQSTS